MVIRGARWFIAMVTGLLLAALAAHESPARDDTRDVVRDARHSVVRSTSGSCVRTKWDAGRDPCAPRVKPKAMKRACELAKEDRTVYFEFNHADISPGEQHKLNDLADILKADNEVRDVRIVGYADRIGSASYNQRLSQRRARNVEHYLQDHGYLNTRLTKVHWLGRSEPMAHCPAKLTRKALIACLRPDRRVVVEIDYIPAENMKKEK